MAEMTDELRALWGERMADPDWFKDGYEAALARLEDHTAEESNPFWWSPASDMDTGPGDDRLRDQTGAELLLDEARRAAFEMLVLVDLAEASRSEEGRDA